MGLVSFILFTQYNKRVSNIIENEKELVDVTYNTIVDAYRKNAEILFATSINVPEILDIFYKASLSTDKIEQNRHRQDLYAKLKHTYTELKKFDIKQLHFHLKNNDSFLRFYRPQKHGDNLGEARKTVVYVNKEHKSINSFEEGKIFNGYRFVFPLERNEEHIGSMELSISMKAIIEAMKKNINSQIDFIIDKKVVDSKVFIDESSNYKVSDISKDFLYEKSINSSGSKDIIIGFEKYKKTNPTYEKDLLNGKALSFVNNVNNVYRVITLHPIQNKITEKTVAYIVVARINKDIGNIKNLFFSVWLGLLFISTLIVLGFYRVKRAKDIADEATNSKSLFLANMSHEIRTPMNAIIGFSDILQKTPLDENQRKHLSYIKSSSSSLLEIINDILDFSKIEAGKLELENSSFKMLDLCDKLYGMLNILAKNKNIEFNFEYKCAYKGSVIGDPTRVGQIIINIVNNAIKFTKVGSVNVTVTALSEDDEEIKYELKVRDTGIGIERGSINKLFNSFVQADSTTNRKFGGTGLGLSITKSLVTLMNGKIEVNSILGVGSEFVVIIKFPKDLSDKNNKLSTCDTDLYKDFSALEVLVAEDNKTNQVLIDIILNEYKIDATIVNDGLEAIDILKVKIFDLVLMDIQMPKLDGYGATKIIRDKTSKILNHEVCVVALSANAMKNDIKLSLEAGMDDHLAKPIDRKKLYNILEKNLKRKENNG